MCEKIPGRRKICFINSDLRNDLGFGDYVTNPSEGRGTWKIINMEILEFSSMRGRDGIRTPGKHKRLYRPEFEHGRFPVIGIYSITWIVTHALALPRLYFRAKEKL